MVKRAKSPEVVEEARYFTVCQPFPLNPNWLFDADQQACATWIAECIGLEHLWAIHHKPSVCLHFNMLIIYRPSSLSLGSRHDLA